ncbi:MAG TPA: sulfurtransferase complex subunit TusB [Pseudomonadales bacterium]
MAVLHLVNRAAALDACLAAARDEDAVLLLEDGVYAAVAALAPARPLHALEPDVRARGLSARLADHVTVVDDAAFVRLVEQHQPVVSWR